MSLQPYDTLPEVQPHTEVIIASGDHSVQSTGGVPASVLQPKHQELLTVKEVRHVLHDADGRKEERQLHGGNDGAVQPVVHTGAHAENGLAEDVAAAGATAAAEAISRRVIPEVRVCHGALEQ